MAKFIYLGKKKGYKLDSQYAFQDELNPGQTFELTGADLVLMKKCMKVAREHGTTEDNMPFQLKDEHEMRGVEIEDDVPMYDEEPETDESVPDLPDKESQNDSPDAAEEDEKEEVVDLRTLTKKELLEICKEEGIDASKRNITKAEIIELIKNKEVKP